MKIISIIISTIIAFTLCFIGASYTEQRCNITEVVNCGDYQEVTVEKDGNLYSAFMGGNRYTNKKSCRVIFYNGNIDDVTDDKIVFLW